MTRIYVFIFQTFLKLSLNFSLAPLSPDKLLPSIPISRMPCCSFYQGSQPTLIVKLGSPFIFSFSLSAIICKFTPDNGTPCSFCWQNQTSSVWFFGFLRCFCNLNCLVCFPTPNSFAVLVSDSRGSRRNKALSFYSINTVTGLSLVTIFTEHTLDCRYKLAL